MRDLASILRAYADGFGVAGNQYATLCHDLREAADELETLRATNSSPDRVSAVAVVCVIDDDVVPGTRCASCED